MSRKAAHTPEDYKEVFRELQLNEVRYCVFGGMGVALWAKYFLTDSDIAEANAGGDSLHTKDLDLRGRSAVSGTILAGWDNAGLIAKGALKAPRSGLFWGIRNGPGASGKQVEVMESIAGLDDGADAPRGYELNLMVWPEENIRVRVLDPISCLVAKLDVFSREREANRKGDRNDRSHIRMLDRICPIYLEALRRHHSTSPDPVKEAARFESLREAVDAALKE